MPLEWFQNYKPRDQTKKILGEIIGIVKEYGEQGLVLTLRQLYYQLVSKDLVKNEEREYKRIGEMVSRARRAGFVDWDAVEDRIRQPDCPPQYTDLDELMQAALNSYRLPRLKGQDCYVELWVEKDALAGVLAPIANKYHVTLMVNRGYSSTSAMRESGTRLRQQCHDIGCSTAYILYLGDLDPSGEDMVRDVYKRVEEYTNRGWLFEHDAEGKIQMEKQSDRIQRLSPEIDVKMQKLALTKEQVEEYEPPPNPAKMTDSRAPKFVAEFGKYSWEVDALPPTVLRDIIEEELDALIDHKLVAKIKKQEETDKTLLAKAVASLRKKKGKKT